MGVRRLLVQGDSELIIKQVNGIFALKETNLFSIELPSKD